MYLSLVSCVSQCGMFMCCVSEFGCGVWSVCVVCGVCVYMWCGVFE